MENGYILHEKTVTIPINERIQYLFKLRTEIATYLSKYRLQWGTLNRI